MFSFSFAARFTANLGPLSLRSGVADNPRPPSTLRSVSVLFIDMSREQLIEHLSAGRSAYDEHIPGLWEEVADIMLSFVDRFYDEDMPVAR